MSTVMKRYACKNWPNMRLGEISGRVIRFKDGYIQTDDPIIQRVIEKNADFGTFIKEEEAVGSLPRLVTKIPIRLGMASTKDRIGDVDRRTLDWEHVSRDPRAIPDYLLKKDIISAEEIPAKRVLACLKLDTLKLLADKAGIKYKPDIRRAILIEKLWDVKRGKPIAEPDITADGR